MEMLEEEIEDVIKGQHKDAISENRVIKYRTESLSLK